MTERYIHIAVVTARGETLPERIIAEISARFECYADIETEAGLYELEFCTPDPFPLETMKEITGTHPGRGLYIQVVTYNLARELVQHHICKDGQWTDRLAERSPYR